MRLRAEAGFTKSHLVMTPGLRPEPVRGMVRGESFGMVADPTIGSSARANEMPPELEPQEPPTPTFFTPNSPPSPPEPPAPPGVPWYDNEEGCSRPGSCTEEEEEKEEEKARDEAMKKEQEEEKEKRLQRQQQQAAAAAPQEDEMLGTELGSGSGSGGIFLAQ